MWTIETTARFEDQYSALLKQYPRLDAAVDGIKWALARDPMQAQLLFPDFGGRGIKTDPWPGVPKAMVYFKTEGTRVILYAIYDTAPNPDSVAL